MIELHMKYKIESCFIDFPAHFASPLIIDTVFRDTGDIKRDDTEMLAASDQVLTVDCEFLALNGKILAERTNSTPEDEKDQASVCSCSCLGPSQCKSHILTLDDIYHPTVMQRSSV